MRSQARDAPDHPLGPVEPTLARVKFTVEYPMTAPGYDPALLRAEGMAEIARTADELGYEALAFTDHPAPSQKWLDAGGHESLDIFATLAFCAAHTSRVRLMTYLLVVPYRNPFVAAKALTTIDLLSSGRLTVGVAAGYLRSEFRAVGVDFEARNALFDEALAVIRGLWRQTPFSHLGEHFQAEDVAAIPMPVQPGGPPIVVGGNSRLSRERAARADGWSPLVTTAQVAESTRTAAITSVEQLGAHIAEMRAAVAAAQPGRPRPFVFQARTPLTHYDLETTSVEEHREHLGSLAEVGVTSFVVRPSG